MSFANETENDPNKQKVSVDDILKDMEDRAHTEELDNQANSCRCIEIGLGTDYVPSYLK